MRKRERGKKVRNGWWRAVCVLTLLLLAQADALQAVEIGGGGSEEQRIVRVVEAVSLAVVFIPGRSIVDQKRAEAGQKMQRSEVIINTEGHILTSAHLLQLTTRAQDAMFSGRK